MILAEIATGSVIIGVALIGLIGALMMTTVLRFDIDAALKMWGALGTLLGLVVGTMGTYFFSKDQIQQVQTDYQALKQEFQTELSSRRANVDFASALREIDCDPSITDKQNIYAAI